MRIDYLYSGAPKTHLRSAEPQNQVLGSNQIFCLFSTPANLIQFGALQFNQNRLPEVSVSLWPIYCGLS